MLEFFLTLVIAFFTGQVSVVEAASSMSSDNPNPSTSIRIEWPCAYFGATETCWMEIGNDYLETGP